MKFRKAYSQEHDSQKAQIKITYRRCTAEKKDPERQLFQVKIIINISKKIFFSQKSSQNVNKELI